MKKNVRVAVALLVIAAIAAIAFYVGQSRTPPTEPTELVPEAWRAARATAMHVVHMGKGKVACAECHGGMPDAGAIDAALAGDGGMVGFESHPGEGTCVRCHAKASAQAHGGNALAKTTCLTCHVFSGTASPAPCASCHGADGAKQAGTKPLVHHVQPGVACEACHDVHGAKGARTVLPDCTVCHATIGARHGSQVVAARTEGDPRELVALDAGVAKTWRKEAGGHVGPTCATCHAPHEPGRHAKDACVTCHSKGTTANLAANAPAIAARGPKIAGHEACTTCHAPHDARKESVRGCAGCHGDKSGATAVSAGHAACTTCHAPHAPTEARGACRTCHEGHDALGASKVAAHAACTSCHNPHDAAAKPAQACASCHAGVHPQHPSARTSKGDTSACTGCHTPHAPKRGAQVVVAFAAGDTKAAADASCSACHAAMKTKSGRGTHGKGVPCASCHRAHDFRLAKEGPAGAAVCARCHAPVASAIAGSPTPAAKGHALCASCHGDAHAPTRSPSCASCHGTEVSTAPKGHAACASCHEPHTGTFTQKGAACTNCHAEKRAALHGNVAQGCATCHRPHGPKGPASPPACTTCHEPAKLPGAHAAPSHAKNCGSCHSSHAPPRSDRATCTTTCHQDRRAHQPDAPVCKGCHIFRK